MPSDLDPADLDPNPFRLPWEARLVCDITAALLDGDGNARVDDAVELLTSADHIHLATMREPWATLIEQGQKRVESRWGKVKCAPHGRVGAGDVVAWKRTGGAVYGVSTVTLSTTDYLGSDADAAKFLAGCHEAVKLPNNPTLVVGKRWLTLVYLGPFIPIKPITCGKRDRAGWNILQDRKP